MFNTVPVDSIPIHIIAETWKGNDLLDSNSDTNAKILKIKLGKIPSIVGDYDVTLSKSSYSLRSKV